MANPTFKFEDSSFTTAKIRKRPEI